MAAITSGTYQVGDSLYWYNALNDTLVRGWSPSRGAESTELIRGSSTHNKVKSAIITLGQPNVSPVLYKALRARPATQPPPSIADEAGGTALDLFSAGQSRLSDLSWTWWAAGVALVGVAGLIVTRPKKGKRGKKKRRNGRRRR